MSDDLSGHVIECITDPDGLVNSLFFGDLILVNGAELVKNGILHSIGYMEHSMDI